MSDQTNSDASLATDQAFSKTVQIHAPVANVWAALTDPELMKKWMADSETELHITTDWIVGHPIRMHGRLHRVKFENRGTVLQYEPGTILQYSHLSSISRLPDEPKSYSVLQFQLTAADNYTALAFSVSNFPTETIYKHLAFYWNVTLEVLKRMLENNQ